MSTIYNDLVLSQSNFKEIYTAKTMSNSDSKSQNTTFTATGSQASTHSEHSITPCHSRTQSPDRCATAMDRDLRGIGCRTEPCPGQNLTITLPSRPLQNQSSSNHSTADQNSIEISSDLPNAQNTTDFDSREARLACESEPTRTPREATPTTCNENLEAIGELFADVPNPVIYTFDESSSSSSNSDDDDIDIEKFARDALSQWFGISIDRFERPIRVIHAFEQVKEQVAAIIEDEGHTLLSELDGEEEELADDDDQDVQDAGAEPSDTRGSSQARLTGGSEAERGRTDRKRLINGNLKSAPLQNTETKISGRKKKVRIVTNLSCPYRKHNPLRFNVSKYEKCANKAYQNMSALKKHLCSEHYNPVPVWRQCGRCLRTFDTQNLAWEHSRQCIHPPQPYMSPQPSDPEDGFNETVFNTLKSRKDGSKIEEWDAMYALLFPGSVVPEPDFEPVVEDHEVAHRFKCSKTALYEEIDHLAAQHTSDDVSRASLGDDIQKLVEFQVAKLLERPNLRSDVIHMSHHNHGYNIDQLPPLGDDYVGVMTSRIEFGEDLGSISEVVRVPGHSSRNVIHTGSQIRPPLHVSQVNHAQPTHPSRQTEVVPAMSQQRSYHQLSHPPLQPLPSAAELEGIVRPVAGTNIGLQGSEISPEDLLMYSQTEPLSTNHHTANWTHAADQNYSWDPNNQLAATDNTWIVDPYFNGSDDWINTGNDSFIGNGQGTT